MNRGENHKKAVMCNIVIPHGFQNHYTIGFTNGLARNGIQISLITSDDLDTSKLDGSIECHNFIGDNSPRRTLLKKVIDYIKYHAKLISFAIKNRKANVHVIGLLKYPIALGLAENLILKSISYRLVLTVHNLLPHDDHTTLNTLIYKLIYRIPDYLVVHTEKMKNELSTMFDIPGTKLLIMQHGINQIVQSNGNSANNFRIERNIPEDSLILLSFGKIAPYKGIDILLESFGMLNDNYYLIIAGQINSKNFEKLIFNGIERNKNKDRIFLINNYIRDEDVITYFSASDVLILPYRHIDQSGVLFLSMSMGLPVIAFNVGMFHHYVTEKTGMIVERKDKYGLRNAIMEFKKEKYDRDEIRNIGKSYEWENVVKPLVELYSK